MKTEVNMIPEPNAYFTTANQWRKWLIEKHNSEKVLWLIFYKVHTQEPTLTYDKSVEEALCYGWIDSTVRTIDEERFARKYTPRTNYYNWSVPNRKRVEKLLANGKMTEIGLNKIGDYAETGLLVWPKIEKENLELSSSMLAILEKDDPAAKNFSNFSTSCQQQYVNWIMSAKREETRIKRMIEALGYFRDNVKNLLK